MSRGKYYVCVGKDVVVAQVRSSEPDVQVANDLGVSVYVQGFELRSGAVLYTVDEPNLPSPTFAQTLVNAGGFWSDNTNVVVRGALWLFGPGRGWSKEEAEIEAARLLSILSTDQH